MVDYNQSRKKVITVKRKVKRNIKFNQEEYENCKIKAILDLINSKDKSKLKKLDGVKEANADKIIDYINRNGHITDLNELNNIRRIGAGTIKIIKNTNIEKNFNVTEEIQFNLILQ